MEEKQNLLARLGQELTVSNVCNTECDNLIVSPQSAETVVDGAKSPPQTASLLVEQQSAQEPQDLAGFLATQTRQTQLMEGLLKEFASVKQDVARLNALAARPIYEDIDSDEDLGTVDMSLSGNVQEEPCASGSTNAVDGKDGQGANASILERCTEDLALTERKGVDASAEMAQLIQKLVSLGITDKKRAELGDKHVVPNNVPGLAAPKVNPEIWRIVSADGRSKDIKFQKIQTTFLCAGVPVVRAVDRLLKNKNQYGAENVAEVVSLLVDSLALISSASADMNVRRRDLLRPEMNNDYQALCSQKNPVTEFLFGDNVGEQLKNITETNKVGLKVRQRRSQEHRFLPWKANARRNHFLFQRPSSSNNAVFRGRGRGRRMETSSGSNNNTNNRASHYQKKF